jgi:hypothetical protein
MNTTPSTPATSTGRTRRLLISSLLALTVFGGILLGTARPAHAAAFVAGCFQTANGQVLAGYPVHLGYYINNNWVYSQHTLDQNGCVSIWTLTATQYYKRLVVNTGGFFGYYIGGGTWYGNSPTFAPGDQVEMGTYRLYYSCQGRVNLCNY